MHVCTVFDYLLVALESQFVYHGRMRNNWWWLLVECVIWASFSALTLCARWQRVFGG